MEENRQKHINPIANELDAIRKHLTRLDLMFSDSGGINEKDFSGSVTAIAHNLNLIEGFGCDELHDRREENLSEFKTDNAAIASASPGLFHHSV